ncbi:MAG: tRNA (adenosine(37)-N6)-threonylcarbamoyltransferase complex ATPase subunit type 1 TsaE [Planctomycetes bacterium]|nr:tRNA (adenosine(37)-N6)-threonylcarbamoyltransferase complex ATPase subunit type 1 TsaE [Planctomycetota bacterium]
MSEKDFEIISDSVEQTIEFGKKIGALLKGGEVFGLIGNLGTGKTHLIKGIAAGAGAPDMEHVNSPTFVIVNEYSGPEARLDIFHLDAYRLDSIAEFEALGFDDLCYRDSVVLIEWADKVLPALKDIDTITIELSHISETQRKFIFKNLPGYLSGLDQ